MDINITVQLESTALRSTALQLEELAGTLERVLPGGLEEVETFTPAPESPAPEAHIPASAPQPGAVAVAPPPPPAPAPPADVKLDKSGLPWDKRIHGGGNNPMKKDNFWKTKRGVDPALVAQVEAELRLQYPAIDPQVQLNKQAATPAPAPLAAPAPAPAAAPITYPEFMQQMQAAMNKGTLSIEVLMAEIKVVATPRGVSIPTLPDLANHSMVLPELLVNIQTRIALGTGVVG